MAILWRCGVRRVAQDGGHVITQIAQKLCHLLRIICITSDSLIRLLKIAGILHFEGRDVLVNEVKGCVIAGGICLIEVFSYGGKGTLPNELFCIWSSTNSTIFSRTANI